MGGAIWLGYLVVSADRFLPCVRFLPFVKSGWRWGICEKLGARSRVVLARRGSRCLDLMLLI